MIANAIRSLKSRIHFGQDGETSATNPEALQKNRVLASGLFVPDYYIRENPDVRAEPSTLIDHFIHRGGAEGRRSHPLFDPDFYCLTYPDVAEAGINPLVHYLDHGSREGRIPHPLFDPDFYLTQLSADDIWERTPLEHYIERGAHAGLNPNPWFSTRYYQSRYASLLKPDENPLSHYVTEGLSLNTDPHPFFITRYYSEANPDVTATGIHPLHHFLRNGWREGRDPNPLFDVSWYGETFGPEKKAWPGAEDHYRTQGVPAKYDPSPALSTEYYLQLHPEAASPVDHLLSRFSGLCKEEGGTWFAPLRLWLRDMYQHENSQTRQGELISVIIPCFNQGRWLEDALLSVHLATRRPLDIIIVDDGSTDEESLRIMPELAAEFGARLITQKNSGLSGARNAGLREARGDFIQFLDSDDLLLRGKIDRQLELGQADLYLSDYFLCNSWCGDWIAPFPSTVKGFPFTYQSFLRNWERGLSIPIHCGLFARAALEGFHFDLALRAKEDWRMWLKLSARDPKIAFLDSSAVLYRQHTSNMGHDPARMGEEFLRAAFKTIIETGDHAYFEHALKHFNEVYVERIRAAARKGEGV